MYTDKHLGDGMAEAADMLQQAIARHQAGDVRGAEVLYRQLLLEHPELSDAWHLLGVCDIQQGNLQSAVERSLRAIRLAPQQSMFYANLGVAYQQQQRWTEAGQAYQQALTLRPDYAEAYHNLGIVWWHLKEHSRAIAAFEQAIRLSPTYLDAYLNLGAVLFEDGDWPK
ncbi:MAG: tetratricopeptide repeat protein, partial [Pirellulaceae bacterium]